MPTQACKHPWGISWDGCIQLTHNTISFQPLAAADYHAIAQKYHTLVISGVSEMSIRHLAPMRRFVNLVDVLYDERVRVVIGAVAGAEDIFVLTRDGIPLDDEKRVLMDDLGMNVSDYSRRKTAPFLLADIP